MGQSAYNENYELTFPANYPYWGISRITSESISFRQTDGTYVDNFPMKFKAIQDEMGEVFDDYGRMSAKLGLEIPNAPGGVKNFALQNFIDPPTEIVAQDQIQIWKITHNGVDTHPVHFHFFEVQVLNRVGWDGFIYLPDPNEIGWKDTVRISPLEDTIVALRPARMFFPFTVPESIRPLNPAFPMGSNVGFSNVDPTTGQALLTPTINYMHDFGHEYLWHCHILSHEEQDMMRVLELNPVSKTSILWWKNAALTGTETSHEMFWYLDGVTRIGTAVVTPDESNLNWKIVGRGDFNMDGQIDILWSNPSTGANRVWLMDRTIRIAEVALNPRPSANSQIVGTGDFNNDGHVDILWRNTSTGVTTAWFMGYNRGTTPINGTITYLGTAQTSVTESNLNWKVVGIGDFDGDGKPDILWRNTSTTTIPPGGNIKVWYMDGVTYRGEQSITPETDQNWKIVGVGDFNSDIKPDILWRNTSGGNMRVWYMDGAQKIGEVPLLPAVTNLNWEIVG